MRHGNYLSTCLMVVLVSCEKNVKSGKRGRLFTFNTVNEDIRVDLDFSIPFISIPVKQTMESTFSSFGMPSVNVNLPALVLGGGVVLASTVLLPLLMKSFSEYPQYQRYAKILDHSHFGADAVLDFAGQMLAEGGVRGCTLRVACWTGQRKQGDAARILDQVMSNQLIASFINTTAVEEAIASGRRGRDCTFYAPCPLKDDHYPMLMSRLAQMSYANT